MKKTYVDINHKPQRQITTSHVTLCNKQRRLSNQQNSLRSDFGAVLYLFLLLTSIGLPSYIPDLNESVLEVDMAEQRDLTSKSFTQNYPLFCLYPTQYPTAGNSGLK